MSDTDLYSRLLFIARHGYPLSKPQPYDNFPRPEGIEIGDVGTVADDGTFIVFFNIRERSDPANRNWGVPSPFPGVLLKPGDYIPRTTHFGPGSHVSNSKLRNGDWDSNIDINSNALIPVGAGSVVSISSSAERTATLLLQEGGSRIDLLPLKKFREQAEKHGEDWYAFVRENVNYELDNGDLYLITGVDKSTLWNVSAAEKRTGNDHISLKLRAVQFGSVNGSYRWEWENGGQFSDSGPRRPAGEAPDLQNQAVFLRGFRLMLSAPFWRKQKKTKAISVAESKPSDIFEGKGFRSPFSPSPGVTENVYMGATKRDANPGAGDSEDTGARDNTDSTTTVTYFPASFKRYHPASVINAHMLSVKSSGVSVAVTHDNEWMSVLEEEEEEFPEDTELIRRIMLKYSVEVESGCAALKPRVTDPVTESQRMTASVESSAPGTESADPGGPSRSPRLPADGDGAGLTTEDSYIFRKRMGGLSRDGEAIHFHGIVGSASSEGGRGGVESGAK
ncbi:Cell division control protein [Mycena sanguinolenta]|uniref:Cell division control protein n=1 Tax=Mycena sanguinolenta TaxID=230812 RepID=A0A8H7DJ64_9AGAR|nr:Cell division control protein [Mycena sanguinolenta]